jgi:hypothetical protein
MADHGFKLPSEEEKLKLLSVDSGHGFKLPSKEEISALDAPAISSGEPTTVEDLVRLGAHGASASFLDEITAGLKSAGEVAFTEKTLKDLPALYEQYKQVERQKIKEAQERNPILGTAAEIGGAIIPSVLTGGTSLAVRGAARFLPSIATSTGAGSAIARGALSGAQYGGIAAAGATEASLLSSEAAEDIAKGAATGGVFGGAMVGAGEAAKGIYRKYAPESRSFKLAGVSAQEAMEGRPSPTSTAGETLLTSEEKAVSKGFAKKFFGETDETQKIKTYSGLRDIQGENISAVVNKAAKESGVKIADNPETIGYIESLKAILKTRTLGLTPKESSNINNLVNEYTRNKIVDPSTANEARRSLYDIVKKLKLKEPEEVLQPLRGLRDSLETELTQKIPEFAQANLKYRTTMEVLDTLLGKRASDVRNVEKNTLIKTRDLIKKAEVLGETGVKAREKLADMKAAAEKAFKLDPESFKKAGINSVDEIFSEIEKQAERASIRQGLGGVDRGPGKIGKIEALLNVVHPYQLGRYGGTVAKKITDLSTWAYKRPDAMLLKTADKLSTYPALEGLANSLRKSIESGNARMKNTVLFALMQKTEARDILREEASSEEGQNEIISS